MKELMPDETKLESCSSEADGLGSLRSNVHRASYSTVSAAGFTTRNVISLHFTAQRSRESLENELKRRFKEVSTPQMGFYAFKT